MNVLGDCEGDEVLFERERSLETCSFPTRDRGIADCKVLTADSWLVPWGQPSIWKICILSSA